MTRPARFGDSGISYVTIGDGICNECKHVSKDGQKCKAFPDGISAEILSGEIDYRKPVDGDHGIQFEARGG